MNRLLIISLLFFLGACSESLVPKTEGAPSNTDHISVITEDYELVKTSSQEGFLILFPCYPCNAENTRTEFNIMDIAFAHNVSVLLMNFNQRLWLTDTEKMNLERIIATAVKENKTDTDNTYMGGFSSGGNVSFLLTDYLKSSESSIQPKGLFIADSPIDLYALYENAQLTLKKNFSPVAVQEANWIVQTSETDFGVGDTSLVNFEDKSPYLSKTKSNRNISNLKGVNIRLYSEPDTLWWKENRQAEYENMNACYIQQLAEDLERLYGKDKVEYIQTLNRGFRANGERHPHSWSIIDEKELVESMVGK